MRGFRFRNFEFRAELWPTLAALAMIALTMSLGGWQTRRAEEKLAIQQRLDERIRGAVLELPASPIAAQDFEHYRVSVRGEFVPRDTMLLDNRVMRGVVGYQVFTPLRIAGGEWYVIVNRGWVAAGARRDELPTIRTPEGELRLEGIAVVPPKLYYELGRETAAGPVVQNLALERIGERTGLKLQPIVLHLTSDTGDGLVRTWERPDSGADIHRGYALQWYLLAALTLVLYVTYNARRIRP